MNENYVEQPKKSGTALKVVLIIITLISIIAAASMGLLYYNAVTNLELVREQNVALGEDRDKYKAQALEYEKEIEEFEQEVADLTKQLAESQTLVETPLFAGETAKQEDADNSSQVDAEAEANKPAVDVNSATTLDVKASKLYDEGVKYTVSVKGANMRSGPGTSYRTVQSVYQGNVVTAYAEDGEWLCIQTESGVLGWVKNTLVTKN